MVLKQSYETHVKITNKDLVVWIKKKIEEGNFSPTEVFRDAVRDLKREEDETINPAFIERLQSNIESLQKRLGEASQYIEGKGLMDDFWKKNADEQFPKVIGINDNGNSNKR